jgi:D-3-phosphoglycerate dehydrogenase / 2-oxoglutarate reductase
MRVLLLESVHDDARALLEAAGEVRVAEALDADSVRAAAAGCGAIITRGMGRIPASVMEGQPALRCVARCGAGVDNIDVAAASRLGLPVVHAPDAGTQSVAEHALMLALAVARQTSRWDRLVKTGRWSAREGWQGVELAGKTLGVVGLGRIGTRTATLGQALGLRVLTWSRRRRDARFEHRELDALLSEADIVSLHVALTDETRGFIDAEALARMSSTSILVNTARGALINEEALVAALSAGRLGGAGLDVLAQEPPPADHPLFAFDDVIITPHVAGLTDVAYRRMCVETVTHVLRILSGGAADPAHVANRVALGLAPA